MKKIVIVLAFLLLGNVFSYALAEERTFTGSGTADIVGYDFKYVRSVQNENTKTKSHNSKSELAQDMAINKATKQLDKRNKQTDKFKKSAKGSYSEDIIHDAENNAEKDAIRQAIAFLRGDDIFNHELKDDSKVEQIISQSKNYVITLDTNEKTGFYANQYVACVDVTIDLPKLKTTLMGCGITKSYQNKEMFASINKSTILVVMDEYWAKPTNLNENLVTKDVTTYKYNKNERESDKESYKNASSNKSAYAGAYGKSGSSSSSGESANKNYNYKNDESEFFQHTIEYAPAKPSIKGENSTQVAFEASLTPLGIQHVSSMQLKSRFFKGKPIPVDILQNHALLDSFIKTARNDSSSNADYIAIGTAKITDNGASKVATGYESSGNVDITIIPTAGGNALSAHAGTGAIIGDSPDDAKRKVAEKLGEKLAKMVSEQIQEQYSQNESYGKQYNIVFKGNFTTKERGILYDALEETNGVTDLSERDANTNEVRYSIEYTGKKPIDFAITGALAKYSMSDKFQDNSKKDGTNIIFYKKGVPCL